MTDPSDFEAFKAQRIRETLVKGTHVPCTECQAPKPLGGEVGDLTVSITRTASGTAYTTHRAGCSQAPA